MQVDTTMLRDGWDDLLGGVDSSRPPDAIDVSNCAFAGNVSFRYGNARNRPRFRKLDLKALVTTVREAFQEQVFLGVSGYIDVAAGSSYAFVAVGGRILRADLGTTSISFTDMNVGDRNNTGAQTYFTQAENFLVIQNGVDIPLIYDGTTIRRSRTGSNNPSVEVVEIVKSGSVPDVIATVETATPHPFSVGDFVDIGGSKATDYFAGQHYITEVTDSNHFVFETDSAASTATSAATGDLTVRFCPEVPIGTIMTYGQGRLFLADPTYREFIAGDLVDGDENNVVENLLRFTETTYLAEGGAFKLPVQAGRITGMRFVSYQDTTTGQGDLIVYGEHGAGSWTVSGPRESWKTGSIQRVLFSNIGCTSNNSIVDFNGDQIFRSLDGVRSYRMARADTQSYGQTPISAEVSRILDLDDRNQLDRVSGINFDNRLILTCAPVQADYQNALESVLVDGVTVTVETDVPHNLDVGSAATLQGTDHLDGTYIVETVPTERAFTFTLVHPVPSQLSLENAFLLTTPAAVDFYHQGVITLDFTPLSSNSNKAPAAYDGTWYVEDGIRQLFTIADGRNARAFFIGRDAAGQNTWWEILRDFGDDSDDSADPRIPSWIESRAFNFQRPVNLKRLDRGDIWISELVGTVDFQVYFRPDQYAAWTLWSTFSETGPAADDQTADPLSKTLVTGQPRYRTQVTLPSPPDTSNLVDSRRLRYGFDFQVRIEWQGNCKIEKFAIYAEDPLEGLQQGAQR